MESEVSGFGINEIEAYCLSHTIDNDFLASALEIKKVAGQINVIIHAAGIIRSLSSILRPGEIVDSVSLGAGNTGRKFDLETNFRVAEYKFIDWKGGSESIRQNGIFKDYFELAEYETSKEKYLYVVGTKHPLKFFASGRSIASILSKQPELLSKLRAQYGESVKSVGDYFSLTQDKVHICDVSPYIGRST